jgi:hypothetical protein
MARNVQFQIVRGVAANIPTLAVGEFYFATDTGQVYIGSALGNICVGPGIGGPSNLAQATVNFGYSGEDYNATVTVSAGWVTSSSKILCNVAALATSDHDPEDAVVEDIQAHATNLNPGNSFDIECYAPNGSWGAYLVNAMGL